MSEAGRHEIKTTQRVSHRVLGVVAIALIAVLGVAIAAQVRGASSGDSLDSARPADLLAVLDNLNRREAALRQEIADLQASLASLETDGSDAALAEARARLAALSIQVGTVPATGPGVSMRLTDSSRQVGPEVLLDAVQELRAAGAEAIQIAGDGPRRSGSASTPGSVARPARSSSTAPRWHPRTRWSRSAIRRHLRPRSTFRAAWLIASRAAAETWRCSSPTR